MIVGQFHLKDYDINTMSELFEIIAEKFPNEDVVFIPDCLQLARFDDEEGYEYINQAYELLGEWLKEKKKEIICKNNLPN